MLVHLASSERFWCDMRDADVRFQLASFYHLRYGSLEEMLDYFRKLRLTSTKRKPASVFLDSGIFTFKAGYTTIPDAKLQDYADSFIEFLCRDGVMECFDMVAEIDYYQDLRDSSGEVLQQAYERVKGWRGRLYEVAGRKLVPVLVPQMTWEEKEELCRDPRFDWVAMASFSGEEDHVIIAETRKHINLAHRHGKKIHLFGQTNTQTNFKWFMDADSCDSSTWVSSQRHGMTFIHRRGTMEVIDHAYQFRRKFYASYYKRIGCEHEKILGTHKGHADFCDGPNSRTKGCSACADQAQENRKSALIAWRDFSNFILRRSPARPREQSESVSGSLDTMGSTANLRPKFRKGWKGRGVPPLYEEFGGYKCPVYRTRPPALAQNITCQSCENFDMCALVDEAEKRHAEAVQVPESSGGNSVNVRSAGSVVDARGALPPGDQGSAQTGLGDGGGAGGHRDDSSDAGPGGARAANRGVACIRRVKGPKRKKRHTDPPPIPSSQNEQYGQAIAEWLSTPEKFDEKTKARRRDKGSKKPPGRPEKTVLDLRREADERMAVPPPEASLAKPEEVKPRVALPVVQDTKAQATAALGVLRRVTPNYTCDTCAIETTCPKFKAGEICAFKSPLDSLDSRSPDSLLSFMEFMLDQQKERTAMALFQEKVQTGGQLDRRVTAQVETTWRQARELLDLKLDIEGADHTQETNRGSVTVNVNNVAPQGGLLQRLFSNPPRPREEPSEPEVIDVDPGGQPHN